MGQSTPNNGHVVSQVSCVQAPALVLEKCSQFIDNLSIVALLTFGLFQSNQVFLNLQSSPQASRSASSTILPNVEHGDELDPQSDQKPAMP